MKKLLLPLFIVCFLSCQQAEAGIRHRLFKIVTIPIVIPLFAWYSFDSTMYTYAIHKYWVEEAE